MATNNDSYRHHLDDQLAMAGASRDLVNRLDPDWFEVWNGRLFVEEVIDTLDDVIRKIRETAERNDDR